MEQQQAENPNTIGNDSVTFYMTYAQDSLDTSYSPASFERSWTPVNIDASYTPEELHSGNWDDEDTERVGNAGGVGGGGDFGDGVSGETIPNEEDYEAPELWMAKALKSHPEVLATRERLRPLGLVSGLPEGSFNEPYRRDPEKAASTEAKEAVTPVDVMQLVLAYLQENDFPQARDMLLNEAKDALPELLDALCITDDKVPPLPPLYSALDAAPEEGDRKKHKGKAKDTAKERERPAIPSNDPFNRVINPVYREALVPLIRLGATGIDVKKDLFNERSPEQRA